MGKKGLAGFCSDVSPVGVPRQKPGTQEKDGWGAYVGQRAETHEEGSQLQGMSQSLCALVSPFITGASAWVSCLL